MSIFHHVTTDGPPLRVPSFRGVRQSRGVCIQKQIPKVLISGIHIRAGSASGIHTPPLPWHPFQKGTLPPCHLYPLSPPNSCLSCFSMFHNVTTDGLPPRVPSFRGVRRSRGVCIHNQISKVLISGSDIRAGSASGIHTPPLSWHPFQKGTLPPCRLHPHTASIARDRRTATASPLF